MPSLATESSSPPRPEIGFPIRVGAIDIGTNAIRLLAAEFASIDRWHELASARAAVRMGQEVFLTGRIPVRVMEDALAALEDFRDRMDGLRVRHYRAVATSAVRESANGEEFVRRALERAGLRVEPITGLEEARLSWLAIRQRVPLEDREWIVADLGGGSLELSLVDADRVHWTDSHALGTVRLLEEAGAAAEDPGHFRRLLGEHPAMHRIAEAVAQAPGAGLIATGGNIEALADIAGVPCDERGVRRLPLPVLRALLDRLGRLTARGRVERLGLRPDRADVIIPAATVYERIAALAGVKEVVVPNAGVRDGVLLDVVQDLFEHASHEAALERETIAGAVRLGQRYRTDAAHAGQVARLALEIFDALPDLHGLGPDDRRILAAAALLHDAGQFISYRRHHKHSYYLIAQAELPGLTPRQTRMVALVARYHRRAEPKEGHEGWADLGSEERERVSRLASILRIADALDREHLQRVGEIALSREGDAVRLEVTGSGDLYAERWALKEKGRMFERVLSVELAPRFREAEPGGAPAEDRR